MSDPNERLPAVNLEQAIRRGIERNLLLLAEGRRVYKASIEAPPDGVKREDYTVPKALMLMARDLEIEAAAYELAAKVVMRGEEVMYSLPSWMWSTAMVDNLFDQQAAKSHV